VSDWGTPPFGGLLTSTGLIGSGVVPGSGAKGSWFEISSALADNVAAVQAHFINGDVNTTWWMLDVGLGAAGSEVVVLPNIPFNILGTVGTDKNSGAYYRTSPLLPLALPKGERVSIRAAADAVNNCTPYLILHAASHLGTPGISSPATTYGAGSVQGTALPMSSGSPAWVQITSGTSVQHSMLVAFALQDIENDTAFTFDIAMGAAGSEQIIYSGIEIMRTYGGGASLPYGYIIHANIPAGTRLAARVTFQGGSTTPNLYLTLMGF
jgi:hypothetical protein